MWWMIVVLLLAACGRGSGGDSNAVDCRASGPCASVSEKEIARPAGCDDMCMLVFGPSAKLWVCCNGLGECRELDISQSTAASPPTWEQYTRKCLPPKNPMADR